ncbi:MAG: hypothetical protein M1822_009360 [Bathelium mastoideum]|nr:MAG: hypothetical protein M1822_009360 [Bathelium mastoideum]
MKDKEKLFRLESHNTTGTVSPAPTYASHPQHVRAESESAQPMLSILQQGSGHAAVDRAYFTGIDTSSEASIHGDGLSGYHDSREGSLVGEAPPPYVRSLGSTRSARSASAGVTAIRRPALAGPLANRRSVTDKPVAEEPEMPRATPKSPFSDLASRTEESPFDDTHVANDDDAISEISESQERERDRMSVVSDLSYQTSLKSLNPTHDGSSRR